MAKVSNLVYALKKLEFATDAALKCIYTSHSAYPQMLSEAIITCKEAYERKITSIMYMTGAAMAPTLNPKYEKDPDAVDKLLLREIPYPSLRHLNVHDVIAFESPYRIGDNQFVLVRRIAALPGEQMLAESDILEPFFIPFGHCWVLADNQKLEPPDILDSRFFGPLPFQNIKGRIIYNGYNEKDHGRVKNSARAMVEDEAILKYEFDIKEFFSDDTNNA